MYTCFIFHYSNFTTPLKKHTIKQFIQNKQLHSNTLDPNESLIIYAQQMEKIDVWQTLLNFEIEGITVGYGFGKNKKEAFHQAKKRLTDILHELKIDFLPEG